GSRQPAMADVAAVFGIRGSRPRDPVDHGARAGGARSDRRNGLGARRRASNGRVGTGRRPRQPGVRRNGAADGERNRILRAGCSDADPDHSEPARARVASGGVAKAPIMPTPKFPVFDLARFETASAGEKLALAAEVDAICRATGFLAIVGHGVPETVIGAAWAKAQAFFDLPAEQKQR